MNGYQTSLDEEIETYRREEATKLLSKLKREHDLPERKLLRLFKIRGSPPHHKWIAIETRHVYPEKWIVTRYKCVVCAEKQTICEPGYYENE